MRRTVDNKGKIVMEISTIDNILNNGGAFFVKNHNEYFNLMGVLNKLNYRWSEEGDAKKYPQREKEMYVLIMESKYLGWGLNKDYLIGRGKRLINWSEVVIPFSYW